MQQLCKLVCRSSPPLIPLLQQKIDTNGSQIRQKVSQKTLLEEHITNVTEPKTNYFNHTMPKSGSRYDKSNSIVKSLKDRNVNTHNIQVVGCDGTNVNTGQMAGVTSNWNSHLIKLSIAKKQFFSLQDNLQVRLHIKY